MDEKEIQSRAKALYAEYNYLLKPSATYLTPKEAGQLLSYLRQELLMDANLLPKPKYSAEQLDSIPEEYKYIKISVTQPGSHQALLNLKYTLRKTAPAEDIYKIQFPVRKPTFRVIIPSDTKEIALVPLPIKDLITWYGRENIPDRYIRKKEPLFRTLLSTLPTIEAARLAISAKNYITATDIVAEDDRRKASRVLELAAIPSVMVSPEMRTASSHLELTPAEDIPSLRLVEKVIQTKQFFTVKEPDKVVAETTYYALQYPVRLSLALDYASPIITLTNGKEIVINRIINVFAILVMLYDNGWVAVQDIHFTNAKNAEEDRVHLAKRVGEIQAVARAEEFANRPAYITAEGFKPEAVARYTSTTTEAKWRKLCADPKTTKDQLVSILEELGLEKHATKTKAQICAIILAQYEQEYGTRSRFLARKREKLV